jgi:nucleoredoxin
MSATVITPDMLLAPVKPQNGGAAILRTALSSSYIREKSEGAEELRPISPESLSGKIIGLYFSAHWCPPCRGFTPKLAEKYRSLLESNRPIEIIFISSDSSEAEGLEYFNEMPWKMLDYSRRQEKERLSTAYSVRGIPSLVLLDESLDLITLNGRDALMTVDFDKIKSYEADKSAAKAALDQKIATLPETSLISQHPHPLQKLASVYRGGYGCDVCGGSGEGWVYHCDQCKFDAHPKCACPQSL